MEERRVVNVESETSFFSKVYGLMAVGVGISALVAILLVTVFKAQTFAILSSGSSWLVWGLMIVELLLVVQISRRSTKNPTASFAMFVAYAALNGLTFSAVLLVYNIGQIGTAFVSSALVFVAMSIYGRITKNNLSGFGRFAMMGLIGVIIVSLVNFFMASAAVSYFLSYAMLIIFIILTAWDNQKLSMMYRQYGATGEMSVSGLAVMGALTLYLDFVNLFLTMLQIFGGGRD
ncbi:Bax inhibitor-1/YccA family protein [Latilactobacillus graminis]|uniref:Integral membrane protein n=2 Tax=Latilactobacillus graminis TaxID=60519 RepID=A0AA89I246_9LACO|nr:Bax inhibitor-1/YccA family protein [Latilactobacillus graminis]KRM23941.1 integral membrane protein [Latilactobacillus graminis DSM 20719]QFP79895.1 Bax inhibitor-1/YccA family protein [Latilactobacillus graminis]